RRLVLVPSGSSLSFPSGGKWRRREQQDTRGSPGAASRWRTDDRPPPRLGSVRGDGRDQGPVRETDQGDSVARAVVRGLPRAGVARPVRDALAARSTLGNCGPELTAIVPSVTRDS